MTTKAKSVEEAARAFLAEWAGVVSGVGICKGERFSFIVARALPELHHHVPIEYCGWRVMLLDPEA